MRTRAPVMIGTAGMDLLATNWFHRQAGSGCEFSTIPSTGSDHDLAAMVRDFIEIGSAGDDSWCSSDADSGFSDLACLADKISFCKHSVGQHERDLKMVVKSAILSITETNKGEKPDACSSSCILYSIVALLQSSGYDAAVCATKWQGSGKVPGGEHEFIDVLEHESSGVSERYIIDIDFRSHFQIARAINPYNAVLQSLPTVFVGTSTKLKQLLRIMVEATTYSLEQNSMPLPPWRSLPYLEAKWESPCQRFVSRPADNSCSSLHHPGCTG